MTTKENGVKELRIRDFPDDCHDLIDTYISQKFLKTKQKLNKQTAAIEMFRKFAPKIKTI